MQEIKKEIRQFQEIQKYIWPFQEIKKIQEIQEKIQEKLKYIDEKE